jgi:hypothetical protein
MKSAAPAGACYSLHGNPGVALRSAALTPGYFSSAPPARKKAKSKWHWARSPAVPGLAQMETGQMRKAIGLGILALWFVSAASLLIHQGSHLLGLRAAEQKTSHPEIPADDPAPTLALLSACDKEAKNKDVLCVARRDGDMLQLFACYRLAYDLYPRKVASESYKGEDPSAAIEILKRHYKPTLLLVFANADFIPPPGSRVEARLPLNSFLVRLSN